MARSRRSLFSLASDLTLLAMESQAVIGLRLIKAASGDASAMREARLMVTEKAKAAADVQALCAVSLASGRGALAPARAVALYRRRVGANRRRLTKSLSA